MNHSVPADVVAQTPRLILRPLTEEDTDAVAALYTDPVGMASKGGPRPRGYAAHTVREAMADYAAGGRGFWAVADRTDGRLIGLCGLLDQEVDGAAEVEVAYQIATDRWGQGLATEAAAAAIAHGFSRLGLPWLVSLIGPDNVASQRVAQKNGLRHEKDTVDGKGRPARVYALSREAWGGST